MIRKRLPAEIQALANHCGATDRVAFSGVSLTQRGDMRSIDRAGYRRFKARQTIDLCRPGFIWRATCGPFGSTSVVDSLRAGCGSLAVRALGLPLLRLADSGPVAKGAMMRYLAELAWAPDALLLNYRAFEGRRIPTRAEVDWILEEKEVLVWRGEVTGWTLIPTVSVGEGPC